MKFSKTTLSNGLRVVCVPMPSMESATVQVLVGAGTRHEEKRANGLAHFLEHMVFKGTLRYPSAQAISSVVDGIGAEINAHTSKDVTAYYIKAWERHITLAFDILSDFVRAPLLKPEEIEREKGVIYEEIAMYEDIPMQKAPYLFEELLYGGSSLGWEILGSRETIARIKDTDFKNYRERNYHPRNMVLSVAGKFDSDKVLKLAEEYFGNISKTQNAKRKVQNHNLKRKSLQTNPNARPEIKLLTRKTEQAHLVLGVRGHPRAHPDRYKEAVLAAILGGGTSSRLFTEIRERRGLAYYVRCDVEHYRDTGYLATRAGVKLGAVEEAIAVILEQYHGISNFQFPISNEELQKAKEYLKGRLALGLEDTHSVADFFGDQEIGEGKIRSVEEIIKGVDAVTLSEVEGLASEFFRTERLNLALIGPFKSQAKFERLLKI